MPFRSHTALPKVRLQYALSAKSCTGANSSWFKLPIEPPIAFVAANHTRFAVFPAH